MRRLTISSLTTIGMLAVTATASAATPTAAELARQCTTAPLNARILPADEREIGDLARCIVKLERERRGADTRYDAPLTAAARTMANTGVTINYRDFASVDQAVRSFNQRIAPRLGRLCQGHWRANYRGDDSGPNGTSKTRIEVARLVLKSTRANNSQYVSASNPNSRFAVVTRQGRWLEGRRSGSVAVLIVGLRCLGAKAATAKGPAFAATVSADRSGAFGVIISSRRRFNYPGGGVQSVDRFVEEWRPREVTVSAGGTRLRTVRGGQAIPEFVFRFLGRRLPRGVRTAVVRFRTRDHGAVKLTVPVER